MAAEEQHPLARRRLDLGYTQEGLAEEAGVDCRTVQRWEAGERVPQPWRRNRLAKALQLTRPRLDDLLEKTAGSTRSRGCRADWKAASSAGHDPDLPEIDDMHRREALRVFSTVGTMLALRSPNDNAADGDDTDYAQLNSHLWRVYALASSKTEVLPLVDTQLGVLTTELQGTHSLAVKQQICAAAGDLYQLKGEIHFDGNDYTRAADSYSLAALASETAENFDLWACAMTRHAYLSVYERRFDEAAPMLDLAAELAHRGNLGLSTRHWVSVVQAEAFAGLGDINACQRALDAAEAVRALTGTVHNGGWLRFDGTRLAEERGTCYAALGRHDLAEAALSDALKQKLTTRRRAGVLTDLATIGAQRHDPDRVVAHAGTVLAEAHATGSEVVRRKLTGLQRHLGPLLGDKRVQLLNREITALTALSAAR